MRSILRDALCVWIILLRIAHPAQSQENVPRYQFGASLGTYIYMGDLTPNRLGSYRTLKPAINLFASRIFSPSWSVRANLGIGKLKGDDSKYALPEYRQQRNFLFTASLIELSVLGEWSVLGRNDISRGWAPYLFGGLGYGFLRIRPDWSRLNTEYFGSDVLNGLSADASHRLPRGLPVVPVGLGTRYYFNDRLGLSAEAGYRLMSTDYLDGFSQSANPTEKDHYGIYSIGAVYRIGKKNRLACPVLRY